MAAAARGEHQPSAGQVNRSGHVRTDEGRCHVDRDTDVSSRRSAGGPDPNRLGLAFNRARALHWYTGCTSGCTNLVLPDVILKFMVWFQLSHVAPSTIPATHDCPLRFSALPRLCGTPLPHSELYRETQVLPARRLSPSPSLLSHAQARPQLSPSGR